MEGRHRADGGDEEERRGHVRPTLNRPLGLDYEEWTAFAERIFAANPYRKGN